VALLSHADLQQLLAADSFDSYQAVLREVYDGICVLDMFEEQIDDGDQAQ
jgi:hypothetical protein